ncbi:MAG: GNAT family N-acetyltransferase [Myxococcota bacterium]
MNAVRLAASEWRRFKAIRLRSLLDAPEAFGSTYAETAARPDATWQAHARDFAVFVAVHEGEDVGTARGLADPQEATDAMLLSMWVDPSVRGQGAGDALVEALITWARTEGFARLTLEVGDTNAPAIRLYARWGFERDPEASVSPGEHQRTLPLLP